MNPDPVPPVRPLLTHVIAEEPLRCEAGIRGSVVKEVESNVTGEGQKTSSVLSRALSRIEMRFRQRQSDCLTEVGMNASPIRP